MGFICRTISWPGTVTSWSLVFLRPGQPGNQRRLQEVSVPSQEIVQHRTPCRTTTCCFYSFSFAQIEQTRYVMLNGNEWALQVLVNRFCYLLPLDNAMPPPLCFPLANQLLAVALYLVVWIFASNFFQKSVQVCHQTYQSILLNLCEIVIYFSILIEKAFLHHMTSLDIISSTNQQSIHLTSLVTNSIHISVCVNETYIRCVFVCVAAAQVALWHPLRQMTQQGRPRHSLMLMEPGNGSLWVQLLALSACWSRLVRGCSILFFN